METKHVNTEIQRSRTFRHGRIATLALAAVAAGLMSAPLAQGVASASSVATQADAGYVSTGNLAMGCPGFVSTACGSYWRDDESTSDHDEWAYNESDQDHEKWDDDESDQDHAKWDDDESDQRHGKWDRKKVVFGKFVYGKFDRYSHDKPEKWGYDESDRHHDKWGHDKPGFYQRAWN
jgi:hypothetical protein